MGDNLNKPMIFVRAEKDYRPEAWLSLIMGKSLYIECHSEGMIDTAFPVISKRVSPYLSAIVKLPSSNNTTNIAPVTNVPGSGGELLNALNTISSQMKQMQEDINAMKAEIKQLQSAVGIGQRD